MTPIKTPEPQSCFIYWDFFNEETREYEFNKVFYATAEKASFWRKEWGVENYVISTYDTEPYMMWLITDIIESDGEPT